MSAIRLCRTPGKYKIFRQDEFCNIQTWVYSAQIRWFKISLWMGWVHVFFFFNDFHCRNKVSLRQIWSWHNTLATRRRHAVQISHETPKISNNFIQIKCWQQHLTQIEKQRNIYNCFQQYRFEKQEQIACRLVLRKLIICPRIH